MKGETLRSAFIFVFIVFFLFESGCSEEGGQCVAGSENCICEESGTCDPGLSCSADNICVEADTDSGDSGSACAFSCTATCEAEGGTAAAGTCPDAAQQCCDMTEVDTDTGGPLTCDIPLRTPITRDIFTADPSAHVFDGTLYVYPSHDEDNAWDSFNMIDYHVFSLSAECRFVDEGRILGVDDVPWAQSDLWAPDAAYRDGTYFFYFPAKDSSGQFHIGVATASSPTGPFTPESSYIQGSFSIDPAVFIDDDGQAYMYFGGLWGGQLECYKNGDYDGVCQEPYTGPALGPRVVRLDSSMKTISGAVEEISILGPTGSSLLALDHNRRFFEGAWMHKRNNMYYLSYSTGDTRLLVYATADNPTGPFTYRGVLLPDHGSGWTTHHSVVEFQDAWYLFYHDSQCSGGNTNQRCVKVADLHYNTDGTIQTVSLR